MERQSRCSRVRYGLALCALALFLVGVSRAQVAGRISGYVRDPSGGAIVAATVIIVSDEQRLQRTVQTDETGFYNLMAVPPGTYRITRYGRSPSVSTS